MFSKKVLSKTEFRNKYKRGTWWGGQIGGFSIDGRFKPSSHYVMDEPK